MVSAFLVIETVTFLSESVAAALIEIFSLNVVATLHCGRVIDPAAFERIYV